MVTEIKACLEAKKKIQRKHTSKTLLLPYDKQNDEEKDRTSTTAASDREKWPKLEPKVNFQSLCSKTKVHESGRTVYHF